MVAKCVRRLAYTYQKCRGRFRHMGDRLAPKVDCLLVAPCGRGRLCQPFSAFDSPRCHCQDLPPRLAGLAKRAFLLELAGNAQRLLEPHFDLRIFGLLRKHWTHPCG